MQIITVVGGDLFAMAALYLGDATQAYRIAEANDLDDFTIYGHATIIIPDPETTPTDGLPPQ